MSQKEGKNVRQYVAWLKGAANLCDFTVRSGTEAISYVDQMFLGRLIAMESKVELNRVGGKAPGKVKGKSHITPGGRDHPYVKGGGGTRDKPCGPCARQHGKEVQCPATGMTCFNCKGIGCLKAACRKPAAAARPAPPRATRWRQA